jgi:hypothetical protein
MRFHSIAVLCALAAPAVDAFGVPRTQVTSFSSRPTTATFAKSNEYDFDFKILHLHPLLFKRKRLTNPKRKRR